MILALIYGELIFFYIASSNKRLETILEAKSEVLQKNV